ncbi:hypothetical protein TI05_13415 [Achromatium sp. WMS3]|nr:hypothetical protein TI05_13415 [Achromatium sp. WMS3]
MKIGIMSIIEQIVFSSRFSVFALAALVVTIVVNGIWVAPAAERLWMLARDPYSNPFDNPKNEWLLDNYFLPWLAHHVVGADLSLQSYVIFCLILFVLGIGVLTFFVHQRHGDFMARCMLIVFAVSPVSLVSFGWLGYVDFITVFFGIILAFFWGEHLYTIAICSLVIGFSHAGQGMVIAAVSFLAHVAFANSGTIRRNVSQLVVILVTILSASFLLDVHLNSHGIYQSYDRFAYFHDVTVVLWKNILLVPGFLWYSLFGAVWILVVAWLQEEASARSILIICMAFMICFFVMLLNLDQTRVFSLLTFPVLLIVIRNWFLFDQERKCVTLRPVIVWMILGSLILPKMIVWNGKPYGSLLSHNIMIGVLWLQGKDEINFHKNRWLNRAFGR